jgi:peptidoglycan-N-acetylmuramic acid deacetylase
VASSARDEVSRVESRIEEEASRMEDALDGSRNENSETGENSETSEPQLDQSEPDESVAPAMSTDFGEIGALSAEDDSLFSGGPPDGQNRPSGPVVYQEKYKDYDAHFIIPSSQKIYLTFDEGYENGYTAEILDVLAEKNVKAVFFLTYPYAEAEHELVSRMVAEGHTLGHHSSAHKNFTTIPLTEAADDIMKLHRYVKAQYGYEMFLFRPPEGCYSEQTLALAQSLGYKTVLWSFAYKDWEVENQPITIEAMDNIVTKAHPGEIMLLHAVSKTNAEILGDVIDRLREDGFEFADYFKFV